MNLNTELLLKVADAIEEHPDLYDQSSYGRMKDPLKCGTPCCVAGWALALSPGGFRGVGIDVDDISLLAGVRLGLGFLGRGELFCDIWPENWFIAAGCYGKPVPCTPSPEEAVKILRAMAKNPGDFQFFNN